MTDLLERFIESKEPVNADTNDAVDGGRAEYDIQGDPNLAGSHAPYPPSMLEHQGRGNHHKQGDTKVCCCKG